MVLHGSCVHNSGCPDNGLCRCYILLRRNDMSSLDGYLSTWHAQGCAREQCMSTSESQRIPEVSGNLPSKSWVTSSAALLAHPALHLLGAGRGSIQ